MDEMEFNEAESDIADIITEYQQYQVSFGRSMTIFFVGSRVIHFVSIKDSNSIKSITKPSFIILSLKVLFMPCTK